MTAPVAKPSITVSPDEPVPSGYPLAMQHSGGLTTLATTRTGLVEAILEGYDAIAGPQTAEHDPFLEARYDFAVEVAAAAQASLLVQAADSRTYQLDEEIDEDVFVALTQDRNRPFLGVRPAGTDEAEVEWTLDVPLVLIPAHYQPFTSLPKPTGRIVWLDPATETTLLDTLAAAGLIRLLNQSDDAQATA
jgi:hypothetical protein